MRLPCHVATLTLAGAVALAPLAAAAQTLPPLASFRAVYDIAARQDTVGGLVRDATGSLVVDIRGSDCAGWVADITNSTTFVYSFGSSAQVTRLINQDNGDVFDFHVERYFDGELAGIEDGRAVRNEDGTLTVSIDRGPRETLPANALLPGQHMSALLERTVAGETMFLLELFEGSDGTRSLPTGIEVLGALDAEPDETAAALTAAAGMADMPRWSIVFHNYNRLSDGSLDWLYDNRAIVYANGIQTDMDFAFPSGLVLEARLTELEVFDEPACPAV